MKVLGIETSCDDTGVAVYDSNEGLLVHRLSSQIDIHKLYGGVVPELAARDHIRKLLPLIDAVLEIAKLRKSEIDAVAYTAGPGLIGALLVGATVGRSLAMALEIPSIGVHHMEGHLLSPMLEPLYPSYPFVCLLVSGGHTMLADVQSPGQYKIIGQTRDDAVGEAFDKFAKVLGLPYPGGPSIEKSAKNGASGRFQFPRPMVGGDNLEFSFSGLKTHAALRARDMELNDVNVADLACNLSFFQQFFSFCTPQDCSEGVFHVVDFGDGMLCTCLWNHFRDSTRMEPMVLMTSGWFQHHSSSSG